MSDHNNRNSIDDYSKRFLDVAESAILLMQSNGKIITINRKGSEIFGFNNEQNLERNWFELVVEDDTRESMIQVCSAMESGVLDIIEYYAISLYDTDFDERVLSWRCESLRDNEGKFLGILGSGIDITSHLRAENQLKSAAKTVMLYLDLMGHDIANRLQAIQVGSEMLRIKTTSVESLDLIEKIESSVSYCTDLIAKVRECSQLFDVPVEERSLTHALRTTIHLVKEKFPAAMVGYGQLPSEIFVEADLHLEILLFNLLENAIIHNPNDNPRVWVKLREVDNGYEVSISDNGPGIPDKKKKVLLNPQKRILGVGLQQTKRIVEKYNGHITIADRVDGRPDKGAKLLFWIPKYVS
jgi:PAS domain S-box-containing protein